MSEQIAVVGAGICGLCTSLALARSGNSVTIYERDIPPPSGGAEEAFFQWKRRGAAQFRHPHAFLAVMCNLLEQQYPDLVQQFWEAGARKVTFQDMLPPMLAADYVPDDDDDNLWLLMCRRATMETVLRRYVDRFPGITINNNTNIVGMMTEVTHGEIKVIGLKTQADRGEVSEVPASLVVDASGRMTKFPDWLRDAGATIDVEDHDADIVYHTRHYRLNPGEEEPPRHGGKGKEGTQRSAGDLGYIKYGVFPGDNGHFSIILCLPKHELELREAVKHEDSFDTICHAIPGLVPWLAEGKSTPTTPAFGFGDIHSVWKHFVHAGKPVALNYFAVGDSAVCTNPLYGRGCSTGIIHAHLLAAVLAKVRDPAERALLFSQRTEEELRPIFKASLREDKNGIKRARAILEGRTLDQADTLKGWLRLSFRDATAAAARADLHVLRGALRTFNLLEKPGDFLKDNHVRLTIFRFMLRGRRKNSKARLQHGPKRDEMLQIIATPATPKQRQPLAAHS